MSKNSGLTAWLEAKALNHKKYHHDMLGEQVYSGPRLMMLKTIGAFEVKGDRQKMWYEMADMSHRINVMIPGSVVKEFNQTHHEAAPLHARRHELLSIEEFHFIVLAPPIDAPRAGQPASRKSEPTFGIKVLKLREFGGGGKDVIRGVKTLREGGGKEVRGWIEELERKARGEVAFARELGVEKQRREMGSVEQQMGMVEPVKRMFKAVDKGKGVDRPEMEGPPKKLAAPRKLEEKKRTFSYDGFEAPRSLSAALKGCAPHVQERLSSAWGIDHVVKAEPSDLQPQASTSKLPPPPIIAELSPPPLRISSTRPEDLGPPKKLPRLASVALAPSPQPQAQPQPPEPRPEQLGPPQKLPSDLSAQFRPPRLEEQVPLPPSPPPAAAAAPKPQPPPPRPEDEGPPRKLPRLAPPPTITTAAALLSTNDLGTLTQAPADADRPSSPSPQFTKVDLSSSDLRRLEAAEAAAALDAPPAARVTAQQQSRSSSPGEMIEWPSSPPRPPAYPLTLPADADLEPDDSLSQPFPFPSSTAPPLPTLQAGQHPASSIHYSQFPQESISVEVSAVLSVRSQVKGQPMAGQRIAEDEGEVDGEDEDAELPPSRQESSGSQGRKAWELAEEAPSSGGVEVKEEEIEDVEMQDEDLESDEEEEGSVMDVFGVAAGGGRKRARSIDDDDDDDDQESEHDGDLPPSSSSQSSDHLAPRPRTQASAPPVNFLPTSSPPHSRRPSQALTHIPNSQPSRSATQAEQSQPEQAEVVMEEGASSSGRKRRWDGEKQREQLRTLNGEREREKEGQPKKRLQTASASPSKTIAQPRGSSTLAPSQPLPTSQPPPTSHSHSLPDSSPPFTFLDPSQQAHFLAEQEYWSRHMELQPMGVVELPPMLWGESEKV